MLYDHGLSLYFSYRIGGDKNKRPFLILSTTIPLIIIIILISSVVNPFFAHQIALAKTDKCVWISDIEIFVYLNERSV